MDPVNHWLSVRAGRSQRSSVDGLRGFGEDHTRDIGSSPSTAWVGRADVTPPTPNLDRLAGEGVRFSRVSCQGPLCMPARASFMTERYVRDHGVYTNWAELAPESPTYVWALRSAGYHTALLGKAHLYRDEQGR